VPVDVVEDVGKDEGDLGKIKNRIIGSGEEQLDQIMFNPRNWRIHPLSQQDALKGVLEEVGWVQQVIVNKRTGNLIDGHLRCQLAAREGAQTIPVVYVDLSEEEEALVLATLDPIAAMAATDKQKLQEILSSVESENEQINQLIEEISERESLIKHEVPERQPNKRNLPIDAIYTIQMADVTCCLAAQAGLSYGIQSAHYRLCPYTNQLSGRHEVKFIDNDYFNYQHDIHLQAVSELKPKYATVRDAMTQAQCNAAEIEYYSLEQILDWAEELSQYAENVIVIPKYAEAIEKIPAKYVLGYSVPTSHGGTPLPIEMFQGRRVHLLGGSWKKQLSYMAALGDDVVSFDNNYIQLQANFGGFVYPDGETGQLTETLNLPSLTNPRYTALAISFGSIGAKVNELYGGNGKPAEEE